MLADRLFVGTLIKKVLDAFSWVYSFAMSNSFDFCKHTKTEGGYYVVPVAGIYLSNVDRESNHSAVFVVFVFLARKISQSYREHTVYRVKDEE